MDGLDAPLDGGDATELEQLHLLLDHVERVSTRLSASEQQSLGLDVGARRAFLLGRIHALQDQLSRDGKVGSTKEAGPPA